MNGLVTFFSSGSASVLRKNYQAVDLPVYKEADGINFALPQRTEFIGL